MTGTIKGGSGGIDPSGAYRIGAVAQLTGLSTDTIRAWERRYALVEPTRTETGLRVYSLADVQRLRLVKELRDQGESVATLASLSLEELESRVSTAQSLTLELEADQGPLPVAILDQVLAMQLRERGREDETFDRLESFESFGALMEGLGRSMGEARVVIVRLPHLGTAPLQSLEELIASTGSRGVVVVYNFAPGKLVRKMRALGAQVLQAPVEFMTLARTVRDAAGLSHRVRTAAAPPPPRESTGENPPPLFTEAQLGRLREIESALDCECPHHLSSIVLGLVAFERYSARCEDLDPRDAEVHRALYEQTGEARVIMEKALRLLCDHEKIEF